MKHLSIITIALISMLFLMVSGNSLAKANFSADNGQPILLAAKGGDKGAKGGSSKKSSAYKWASDDDVGKKQKQKSKEKKKGDEEKEKQAKEKDKDKDKDKDKEKEGKNGDDKKGLEKQREKKAEQEQKELGKGSEQGQESREEHRKKWWKFWE